MTDPMQVRINIDRDDPAAYQVEFLNKVSHTSLVTVLVDLLNRLTSEVETGQSIHPELAVTPIPGGDDDIFGGSG